ncbi:MAG: type II CAAX prenyl endopeptidase Rce1 family protein, partial [Luteolibacter sp.]
MDQAQLGRRTLLVTNGDPTLYVLTGAFGIGVGIFLFAAWWRRRAVLADAVGDPTLGPPPLPPPGAVPCGFYRPTDLLGGLLIVLIFGSFALSSAVAGPAESSAMGAGVLITNILFQFIVAGIVTLSVARRCRPLDWLGLRWSGWPWVFLIAPAAVCFMWTVTLGLYFSGYMDWIGALGVDTTQDSVKLLRQNNDPLTLGLMAAAALLVAPFCEEIVFRGYLYPMMKKSGGTVVAAIASAMIFAAAHGHLAALIP